MSSMEFIQEGRLVITLMVLVNGIISISPEIYECSQQEAERKASSGFFFYEGGMRLRMARLTTYAIERVMSN